MTTPEERIRDFLQQKRIAVAGVSRGGKAAANLICQKLRAGGRHVVPVNPNAGLIDGEPCYPDL